MRLKTGVLILYYFHDKTGEGLFISSTDPSLWSLENDYEHIAHVYLKCRGLGHLGSTMEFLPNHFRTDRSLAGV